MSDQVMHLRERQVSCALLSSTVSKDEAQVILRQVRTGVDMPHLLYVTPERIVKSKQLLAALQQAYEAGRLARIVVDEAHCCSMMGHDYRPDYNKLSLCRKLFPQTPIMGLSATLGKRTLQDVLRILGLPSTTDPSHAQSRRTIYFRAPLHRPNLYYRVLTRPSSTVASQEQMVSYILSHHENQSGIVYCLSRKDTHTLAHAIAQLSHGRIRTGVYHSDLDEAEKQNVHRLWRTGDISVVCATIAFGMGIDKGNVRFVIHACISKSLDGYYQETGRAMDMQLTVFSSIDPETLFAMMNYAQSNLCRRTLFAQYFEDPDGVSSCGVCDNCERGLAAQVTDVSLSAWKVVRAAEEVHLHNGRVTLSGLADLVRGLNHAQFRKVDNSGAPHPAKMQLDLPSLGGKVTLSREDCERLVVELLLQGYLSESYQATAYTVNVSPSTKPRH
ncbi:unnamed protein product [Malassezia sympodialis ATCC 42132]|uniref:uncharacterized protein n=1 Tax=Malassezia sympodialis (strain ATCC 42132) TaxID=1230383 RepID=UPI0002C24938|nr:uncharacterized protein MSY001_0115 [Malassezia sympodialis ATCC 42132]CCU97409.1 unnamed protein product [Malassezia sympodialis ATCC 42132]|eukprot:XP_018738760.1 uncharacterized protein MSY001_0115 [Malassezia sympodialis ATCC 42132]